MVGTGKVEEILKREVEREYDDVLGKKPESLEQAVEILFDPSNEGYSTSYANVVEATIREITGRPVTCWPLAECWDLLLTENGQFLGVAEVRDGAPYLCFDYLVGAVKKALEVVKKHQLNYYQLEDSEGTYGIVATPLPREEFEKLLDEYRNSFDDYDNWGFVEFLEEKGIEVRVVSPESVWF